MQNSMWALLAVGVLGLLVAWWLAGRDRNGRGRAFWPEWLAALFVSALAAVGFLTARDWYIRHAHFFAAGGLLVCVIVVALANAVRTQQRQSGDQSATRNIETAVRAGLSALGPGSKRKPLYSVFAWLLAGAAVIGVVTVEVTADALFWVEIGVAALFIVFWIVQTWEQVPAKPDRCISAPSRRFSFDKRADNDT